MDYDELEKMLKERKKKRKFSKKIVLLVIFLMVIFAIGNMYTFVKVGSEQTALILAVTGFLTVELWNLKDIKNKETEMKGEIDDEHRDI